MRQIFNQLMGKKPTMLTPSQMAMQELSGGFQQAWQDGDGPPKLIDKKAGEKSLAPVRDRGLTVGEQRKLREQGRPDLAQAQYDSTGKQWVLPTNEAMDSSRIDPSRVQAGDGQGWVRATTPNASDKGTLSSVMSPETRSVAPVPTWQDFMERNPQLSTPEGQRFLDRHPGIDGGVRMPPPDTGGLLSGGDAASRWANAPKLGGEQASGISLGQGSGRMGGDASLGGGGGMSMLGGALGGASSALNGIMSDAADSPMPQADFDSRSPVRDAALARAMSGQAIPMRGLRYGGYVAPGEEVLVGEDAPEKVIARPDGGVDVVPLDPDANARNIEVGINSLENIAPASKEGRRYTEPPPPNLGAIRGSGSMGEYAPTEGMSGRTSYEGSDTGGIPMDAAEAMADEGSAPPPRRSLLDTKRIIARNNDGLTDEGVWNAREDVLKEDQWRALNEPVKKSKWKDIGMMLLTSLNNQVNNRQDPVRTWGEIKRDEKAAQLAPQLQVLQQRRAENDRRRTVNANIDNTREDNKRLADIAENNRTAKAEALTQKKREAFYRTNKFFDPTKATDAQKRQLAEIGETPESVGQYDFTKPDTKMVAGVLYQRNPSTGAYEDTGVKDPSKQVVDYTIVDPDTGVTQKYSTTSERAASLKTQLKAAGMQIQAATERQVSQQTYQAGENAQNRAVDMQKFMVGYNERLQKEVKANIFKAQEEMVKIKKALDDRVIDQDTFNQMMNTVQNLMK